jgi:hypothetical protein
VYGVFVGIFGTGDPSSVGVVSVNLVCLGLYAMLS